MPAEENTVDTQEETGAESATSPEGAEEVVVPAEPETAPTQPLAQDLIKSPLSMTKHPENPEFYLNNLASEIIETLNKYPQEYLSLDMRNRTFNTLLSLGLAHCKFKLAAEPFMAAADKDANGIMRFVTQARPVVEDVANPAPFPSPMQQGAPQGAGEGEQA